MDGETDGQLAAAAPSPRAETIAAAHAHLSAGSDDDDDCDDLYGDVNVGFLPLPPLSPSPAPTSPPKTPSPGRSPSPSPPPQRAPAPEPPPVQEPKPSAPPQYQPPPRPAPPPSAPPRHQMSQRAPRGGGDAPSSASPPGSAVYISELPWWATDAEVEAALAAHPLRGSLHFYADKYTGKSRGICRADFPSPAAAASAAASLHGRAFHGRHCVASLSRPAALNRLGDDSYPEPVQAAPNPNPNPARGRGNPGLGRGAGNATPVRGNVGPILGDRPAPAPRPPPPMDPRPRGPPFGGPVVGGGGYGGFQALGQFNSGMGAGMMPSAVAPAFLAAGGMGMGGPGMWHDQAMAGGLWDAQLPWNFRGCQMPWQQQAPPMQVQHADGEYGKGRGMRRGRPGRSDERGIGNVRSYPERRQSDHDGGDWYKDHEREERGRRRERVPDKEREPDRHWDDGDRRRGDKRRYQEYTENDNVDRRARPRARSQSRDDDYDDHPRKRR